MDGLHGREVVGVTNPMLPRSLDGGGSSAGGVSAGGFRSRFLTKNQSKRESISPERPFRVPDMMIRPPSPPKTTHRPEATYSSEDGMLRFTVNGLSDEDEDSASLTLGERVQRYNGPAAPSSRSSVGPTASRGFKPGLQTIKSSVYLAQLGHDHRGEDDVVEGENTRPLMRSQQLSASASKPRPKSNTDLSISIREFLSRTDPSPSRQTRASSLLLDAPDSSSVYKPRASSVARDSDLMSDAFVPSRPISRFGRAATISRTSGFFNGRDPTDKSASPRNHRLDEDPSPSRQTRGSSVLDVPADSSSYYTPRASSIARDYDLTSDSFPPSRPISRFGRAATISRTSGFFNDSRDPMDKSALPRHHWLNAGRNERYYSSRASSIEPRALGRSSVLGHQTDIDDLYEPSAKYGRSSSALRDKRAASYLDDRDSGLLRVRDSYSSALDPPRMSRARSVQPEYGQAAIPYASSNRTVSDWETPSSRADYTSTVRPYRASSVQPQYLQDSSFAYPRDAPAPYRPQPLNLERRSRPPPSRMAENGGDVRPRRFTSLEDECNWILSRGGSGDVRRCNGNAFSTYGDHPATSRRGRQVVGGARRRRQRTISSDSLDSDDTLNDVSVREVSPGMNDTRYDERTRGQP